MPTPLPRIALGLLVIAAEVGVCLSAAGCGAPRGSCAGLGAASPLLDRASAVRLELWGPGSVGGASCDGDHAAATSGTPSLDRTFSRGQPLALQLAPGRYLVALTALGDGGSDVLGRACGVVDLAAGATCVPLSLVAAMGPLDAAAPSDGARPPDATLICPAGFADCDSQIPGCETDISTVAQCGACNVHCDTTTTIGAACDDGRCVYSQCAAGRTDCNVSGGDADGCECDTPACCGASCQVRHTDGLGHTFLSCSPVGAHAQGDATAACAAFTGDASLCSSQKWGSSRAMCSTGTPTCACWGYSGSASGHVTAPSGSCQCPTSADPSWVISAARRE